MSGLAAHAVTLSLGRRAVLHEATVVVAPGEIVGVIGPNGAGKSTLLRTLAGIQCPDAGEVTLDGCRLAAMARDDRARRLSFLPQEGAPPPSMRVEDLVALGRLPHRAARDGRRDRSAVERALAETGLLDLRGRPASQLSGGERARLRLARALAVEAPYLLADEPVAALDPAHALAVMASFGRLAEAGMGAAVVLHDLTLAGRFCHRLVLMRDGRVVSHGRPAEILTDAAMRAVYGVTVRRVGDAVVPWSLVGGRSEEDQMVS